MTTTTYQVKGMTCDHCVRAVTDELNRISGVSAIEIDLGTGSMTVTSAAPLNEQAVRGAVEEAGYELVG